MTLTNRELQVLALVAKGLSNREISQIMQISSHTAKFHVSNLARKFSVNNRTEIAVHAVRQGLV